MASNRVLFRVEKLRKDYVMGEVTVSALRGVDLEIFRGEFLTIIGPSGSGKSTLLNIIGGLDTPTAGNVWFGDEDLSQYSPARLTLYRRRHIGFVFQFYNLIPNLTARENVEMATEISDRPMDPLRALELVGLRDRSDHFPSQLSGGEQQRVAIARAVAKQPEILLCDEPTGALDYSTGKVVLALLRDINRKTGTTVVIITHNAAVGGMADRMVRFKDGHVAEVRVNPRPLEAHEIEW
ncbi:MAG: ABC transporter ATP-binding protein [Candidatus Sumerlaeia bacterium]|nr:ABC transporter ATP-binding protein [Candidatus Sumerlaeia bacterium]